MNDEMNETKLNGETEQNDEAQKQSKSVHDIAGISCGRRRRKRNEMRQLGFCFPLLWSLRKENAFSTF
jgi:hypothetical protein